MEKSRCYHGDACNNCLSTYPLPSVYGIFTYIYHIFHPLKTTIHVGKYTSPMDGKGYVSGPGFLRCHGALHLASEPFAGENGGRFDRTDGGNVGDGVLGGSSQLGSVVKNPCVSHDLFCLLGGFWNDAGIWHTKKRNRCNTEVKDFCCVVCWFQRFVEITTKSWGKTRNPTWYGHIVQMLGSDHPSW